MAYPPLNPGTTTFAFTGAQTPFYQAATSGVLSVQLWGAGGSGGLEPQNRRAGYAGGGGYTTFTLPINAGDTIGFNVGGAGQPAQSTTVAGAGGYPDGGAGGVGKTAGYVGGGGGGGTYFYYDGTIYAAAGGGGGGCFIGGGEAGGITGTSSTNGGAGGGLTAGGAGQSGSTASGNMQGGSSASGGSVYAGGGGGGGWYGGGGGSTSGYGGGGGGGTGYVTAPCNGFTYPSSNHTPYDTVDPPTGTGLGGLTGSSTAIAALQGGNGYAIVTYTPNSTTLTLGSTPVSIAGDGRTYTFTAEASGALNYQLWGGAGGGGLCAAAASSIYGGSGGYAYGTAYVNAGDTIILMIGTGGACPASSKTNAAGGWPDGGTGGYGTDGGYAGGGGGGSTRLYYKSTATIIAIAGGGGGGFGGSAGAGGGLVGQNATGDGGLGGTQTTAGVNAGNLSGGSSVTNSRTAGGGGGGGWYGGGSGSTAGGAYSGGGGGSGFIGSTASGGLVEGNLQTPGIAPPSGAPSTTATGGLSHQTTYAPSQAGGSGYAVLSITPTFAKGQPGTTNVFYSGARQSFTMSAPGVLTLQLWGGAGGGGGGGGSSATSPLAGAGGYAAGTIQVNTGDVIAIDVGGGGQPTIVNGTVGAGGFPDGGSGGTYPSAYSGGAGGGCTRVYQNNVLMLVAGGGGGTTGWTNYLGGPGGGTTGGVGTNNAGSAATHQAGGGSQTAGGVSIDFPTNTSVCGGSFYGGIGTYGANTGSAGGGGGYYGGAGGATKANSEIPLGGGGGSGYVNPIVTSSTLTQGNTNGYPVTPTGYPPSAYGIGVGGLSYYFKLGTAATSQPTPGGNGFAFVTFSTVTLEKVPIGTVNLTAAAATVNITANPSGAIKTVTMTGPNGTVIADVAASTSGGFAGLNVLGPQAAPVIAEHISSTLGTVTVSPANLSVAAGDITVEVDVVGLNLPIVDMGEPPSGGLVTQALIAVDIADEGVVISEVDPLVETPRSITPDTSNWLTTIPQTAVIASIQGGFVGGLGEIDISEPDGAVFTGTQAQTASDIPAVNVQEVDGGQGVYSLGSGGPGSVDVSDVVGVGVAIVNQTAPVVGLTVSEPGGFALGPAQIYAGVGLIGLSTLNATVAMVVTGLLGSITIHEVDATVEADRSASAGSALPGITLSSPSASVISSTFVTPAIAEVDLSAILGTVEADISATASGDVGAVNLIASAATVITGIDGYATGDAATVSMTPTQAAALQVLLGAANGTLNAIDLSVLSAAVTAGALAHPALAGLSLVPPALTVSFPGSISGPGATLNVISPSGFGYLIIPAAASGPFGEIDFNPPNATAGGGLLTHGALATVALSSTAASGTVSINAMPPLGPEIGLSPPAVILYYAINILTSLKTVTVSPTTLGSATVTGAPMGSLATVLIQGLIDGALAQVPVAQSPGIGTVTVPQVPQADDVTQAQISADTSELEVDINAAIASAGVPVSLAPNVAALVLNVLGALSPHVAVPEDVSAAIGEVDVQVPDATVAMVAKPGTPFSNIAVQMANTLPQGGVVILYAGSDEPAIAIFDIAGSARGLASVLNGGADATPVSLAPAIAHAIATNADAQGAVSALDVLPVMGQGSGAVVLLYAGNDASAVQIGLLRGSGGGGALASGVLDPLTIAAFNANVGLLGLAQALLGEIDLSLVLGQATAVINAAGSIAEIDLREVDGLGATGDTAVVSIPEVDVAAPTAFGGPGSNAVASIPVVDLKAMAATLSAGKTVIGSVPRLLVELPTYWYQPYAGRATGGVSLAELLSTVTLLPPGAANDFTGIEAFGAGALSDLTVTAPEASSVGSALAAGALDVVAINQALAQALVSASEGGLDLPRIVLVPVLPTGNQAVFTDSALGRILVQPVLAGVVGGYGVVLQLLAATLVPPDGYANDNMPGKVLFLRSSTPGKVPTLAPREIAINEADGVLYFHQNGATVASPLQAVVNALAPTGGQAGQVLRGDGTWGAAAPDYTAPVLVGAQSGDSLLLSQGVVGQAQASVPVGRLLYRPFFVPTPCTLTSLSLDVATPAAATALVGVCAYNVSTSTPGTILAQGSLDCSATGVAATPVSCFLTPGWYAAMVAVTGGSPVFSGYDAPLSVGSSFKLQGDASAPFTGSALHATAPTAHEQVALALITAMVA